LIIGIIASGPSATIEDAKLLRSVCDQIIAVNDSWRLCRSLDGKHFADHIYGSDMKWWNYAIGDITRDFDGKLWTQRVQWTQEPENWGITCLESEPETGQAFDLCAEPGRIHTGLNSGYAAINLAYHLGAKSIILLGYDMGYRDSRTHWFNDRPDHLNVKSDYTGFIKRFNTIDPKKHGIEILNASRKTALTCFPLVDLEDLVETEKQCAVL